MSDKNYNEVESYCGDDMCYSKEGFCRKIDSAWRPESCHGTDEFQTQEMETGDENENNHDAGSDDLT